MPGFADVMKQLGSAAFQIAPALMGPGVAKGFYDAQAEHNKKQLDIEHNRAKDLGNFYLHLASNPNLDPQIAQQYNHAAATSFAYEPLNPQSRKEFEKVAKLNPADPFTQAYENKQSQYKHELTNSPANTQGTNFGDPAQANQSIEAAQQPSMNEYIKSQLGPEPTEYDSAHMRDRKYDIYTSAYQKRLENTIPTPASMRESIGAPYMDRSMANPFATSQGRIAVANINKDSRLQNNLNLIQDPTTGEFRQRTYEELPPVEKAKVDRQSTQENLANSLMEWRKLQAKHLDTKDAQGWATVSNAGKAVGARMLQAETAHLRYLESAYGTGADGSPLPGAPVMHNADGSVSPVGTANSKFVTPTINARGRAESANAVIKQGEQILSKLQDPSYSSHFGYFRGPWVHLTAEGAIGTNDPSKAELVADLASMASLLPKLHDFRAKGAMTEFLHQLNVSDSPQAIAAAIKAFQGVAKNIGEDGDPQFFDNSGIVKSKLGIAVPPNASMAKISGPPASSSSSPQYSVGQTVTLKSGKKIKIKAVQGTKITDYDEVN
jgi:hypothetical protein